MPLPSANKIANEGATAQGRLSASEFNDLINYTAALPVDIQMNGSTILNSSTHIANIPLASSNTTGVITSNFYTYLSAMYEDYSQNGFAAEDHTHTASDVTDLGTAATKNVGVANGVAGLNASGVVPVAQLPSIATTKSDWNATEQQDGYINNKPTVPHISAAQTYISETDGTNTAEVGTVAHPIYAATNAVNATTAAGYTSDGGIATALEGKVDKVTGKGLSTNDYTTAEKTKLAGIATGAEVNVQSDWFQENTSSDDYIKNKLPIGARLVVKDENDGNKKLYIYSPTPIDTTKLRIARRGKWKARYQEGGSTNDWFKQGWRCINPNTSGDNFKYSGMVVSAVLNNSYYYETVGKTIYEYQLKITRKGATSTVDDLTANRLLNWFVGTIGGISVAISNGCSQKLLLNEEGYNQVGYHDIYTLHYGIGLDSGRLILPFKVKIYSDFSIANNAVQWGITQISV